jgi:hypothetical protein
MTESIRMRDIVARKQATPPQPQVDDRAERFAANAAKHLAAKSDPTSWENPAKYEPHLVNYFDANPLELISVRELLETSYFSQEDRETGVAAQLALDAVRDA